MARKRRKNAKYGRDYPNNPKKEPLEKKIPFNRSIKRGVVLAFADTCDKLGVDINTMTEELLKNFTIEINASNN